MTEVGECSSLSATRFIMNWY